MCYILSKPFTQIQKNEFLITYQNEAGLRIEETEIALYALESNEILSDSGEVIQDPDYEAKQTEKQKQARIAEIKAELENIDKQSQRSARAISLCILNETNPNPEDIEKLTELENQAQVFRKELQELEGESATERINNYEL